jgi:hypothetical protein
MRLLLAAAAWLALVAPCSASDRARVLLSDHTVICSPHTPVAAARHLVDTWGALLCTVASDDHPVDAALQPWVGAQLSPGSDPAALADSLLAWRDRLHLTTAIVTDDQALADAAAKAGLRVFAQTYEFQRGDLAIPDARGYLFFHGPAPVFFDRAGYLQERLADTLHRSKDGWVTVARSLATNFSPGADATDARWRTLLSATHTADSLALAPGTDPRARAYGERWRHCLAWWLAPTFSADTLSLFVGQESRHTIRLEGAQGPVTLAGIESGTGPVSVSWSSAWPVEIAALSAFELVGTFRSERAGPLRWNGAFDFRFDGFRFSRGFSFAMQVETAVQARFIPPVLFTDGKYVRTDPDFEVCAVPGQLEIVNRTTSPLDVLLLWRTESPIELSAAVTEFTLAAGETKRTGYTLSVPKQLSYQEYGFAVDVSAAGSQTTVRGQLWKDAPRRTGGGSLGAVGGAQAWLLALPDLGVKTAELAPGSLGASGLASADAVVLCGGVGASSEADVQALSDWVNRGGVALVDIERHALSWLPWPVNTVRRPGPFAASFYKESLDWWRSPNPLVGGCFAAENRDSVLTLAAGESGWEPLIVDDGGKGFMYRKRYGRGWYVVIHSGWWPRLEQLERRAHLGLFNLLSAASR